MSSNARRMPEINLEDFERKLRAAGSGQGGVEDPLEELTRLVNTIANERPRDERIVDFTTVRPTPRPAPPPSAPQLPPVDDEPEFAPPPEAYTPPQRSLPASREDSPPLEAPLLRPSFEEAMETAAQNEPADASEPEAPSAPAPVAAPARNRSWYVKIGGMVGFAAVVTAGLVAYKLGPVSGALKTPPMILAASGPNKVAPPDEKTVQSASDTGALLTKDSATSAPAKVVVNQEQPVDLAAKGDSPVAPMKDSPIIAPNQGPMVVAPGPAAAANPPAPAPTTPAAPQTKAPKTVSVRPDGTLIVAGVSPTTAPAPPAPSPSPAPRKPDPAPSVTTQSASPTLELPPAKAPKSSQRVAVGKTDTTAPTEPVSAPLQLGSAATEKPAKPPTKLSPPQQQADAQAPAPAVGGGEWAVQLAAPRSDAEAQSAIQRLQTKYGSALGDTALGVKKAEVGGETIYRVRASGLSKADASALCQKLKADGGDCFLARN